MTRYSLSRWPSGLTVGAFAAAAATVVTWGAGTASSFADTQTPTGCDPRPSVATVQVSADQRRTADSIVDTLESSFPEATAASVPSSGSALEPTIVQDGSGIGTDGGLVATDLAQDVASGYSVGKGDGAVCLTPTRVAERASAATIVNGDTVLYANTDRDTSTLVRPTATGAESFTLLDTPDAPNRISWDVDLGEGQELTTLADGTVAVVIPRPSVPEGASFQTFSTGLTPGLSPADEANDPRTSVGDADAQLSLTDQSVAEAQAQTDDQVVYVFGKPWATDANGDPVQVSLSVHESTVTLVVESDEATTFPVLADPDLRAAASTVGGPLRTMSFNIRGGTPKGGSDSGGGTDYDYYVHQMRVALEIWRTLGANDSRGNVPGVAALQEVCSSDLPTIVAALNAWQKSSIWTGSFQKNTTTGKCPGNHEFGNATVRNVGTFSAANVSYNSDGTVAGQIEPRGFIRTELNVRGRAVMIFNTHLDPSSEKLQQLEVDQLADANSTVASYPRITMGDFNIIYKPTVTSRILKFFYTSPYRETEPSNSWTYSQYGYGINSVVKEDYTFYAGSRLSLNGASVHGGDSATSDHRPLVSSFDVN